MTFPFISNKKFPRLHSAFIAIIIIAIVSIIPIIKTFGKLTIGYDAFIPLIPENSLHLMYQWTEVDNGSYIGNNHVEWIGAVLFLKQMTGDIYRAAFLYQFLIFFLSGIGIYTIYNVFNKKYPLYGLLPAIFFILSPHLLDHMPYYQGTVGIIWSTYFLIKFLKYKNFTLTNILILSFALGIITDLPNPKYHFLLLVLFIVAILLGLVIKLVHLRDIVRNLKYFMLILLCTTYISIPLMHFGYSFLHTSDVTINTRAGYEEFGQTLDYGAANIYKMMSLFHIPGIIELYGNISQGFVIFVYYAIPFIVFGLTLPILPKLDLEKRKITILYMILGLFFVFFSKSSNPPLGFIYEWLLSSSQFFAFMRTTAGIVIYAAIFYSLIFGIIFQYLSEHTRMKKYALILGCVVICIAGFPIWSGIYFEINSTNNGPTTGLRLPPAYFKAARQIRQLKLDTKLDIYPYAQGYQGNTWRPWNYYGYIIYPWIFDKPVIAFKKIIPVGKVHSYTNARYIVHDKSIGLDNNRVFGFDRISTRIFFSGIIDIYRKKDAYTIPHVYTPTFIRIADDVEASINKRGFSADVAFYQTNDITNNLQDASFTQPFIEYKKINPTKYRVRIHQATDFFQLLFSENYHPDWMIYLADRFPKLSAGSMQKLNTYTVTPFNKYDQSTKQEVVSMIAKGTITSIRENDDRPIQFISKQFLKTVQNDNLPSGIFYETFGKPPLKNGIKHYKVNGFANSWIVDTASLCKNERMNCIQNPDGTYDFELVLEFWPQKLKNMMYVVSIGTAALLVFISLSSTVIRQFKRSDRKA